MLLFCSVNPEARCRERESLQNTATQTARMLIIGYNYLLELKDNDAKSLLDTKIYTFKIEPFEIDTIVATQSMQFRTLRDQN